MLITHVLLPINKLSLAWGSAFTLFIYKLSDPHTYTHMVFLCVCVTVSCVH